MLQILKPVFRARLSEQTDHGIRSSPAVEMSSCSGNIKPLPVNYVRYTQNAQDLKMPD